MSKSHIEILGAPIDLGADRRGVDMGPSAIRYAGLIAGLTAEGHEVTDLGNLPMLLADGGIGVEEAKYLDQIVATAADVRQAVRGVVDREHLPLILGGDHSVSLGSVSGAAAGRQIGLIWLDAHGDFNTPSTTPSGNVHGMVLAALAGIGDPALAQRGPSGDPGVKSDHVALVGVRELDPGERDLLRSSAVHVFTMSDIDHRGIAAVMTDAVAVAGGAADGIHLSLDLDVMEPAAAPGVGTPVAGGLTYREAHLSMEMIAATQRLASMDVVEVNPILDHHNQTAELAVELVLSALGKRTL